MKIAGKRYPNLIRKPSGFYWNPPPGSRGVFSTTAFGKEFGPEQMERYYLREASLARWRAEQKGLTAPRAPDDTVDALFRDYLESTKVTQTARRTQDEYRRCLTALADFPLEDGSRFGDQVWATLKFRHADALFKLFVYDENQDPRPVYARGCMAVARQAWNWARRAQEEQFKVNPFEKMGLKAPKARKVKWTSSEVLQFIAKAEEMGLISVGLAAVLCYELGQRVSDARRMLRSAFARVDGRLAVTVVQQKTEVELLLPVSNILECWLDKVPEDRPHLVVSEATGRPYRDYELSKAAAAVRAAAGIRNEVRIGDLRRTCVTELGRAGATDDELISVTGHSDRTILRVYSMTEYEKALAAMQRRWAQRNVA